MQNLHPAEAFQHDLLTWFHSHGRKQLPWQQNKNPYFVWLSEIMLQQTQVKTVIPYFKRFIQRFESLSSLAAADLDEVLSLWSGLGYYARARNLHQCAQIIQKQFKGNFPQDLKVLQGLPGIGRSTAGAIAALAFNQFASILDGNVKRVLTRFCEIKGWPGLSAIEKKLWKLADYFTPTKNIADYTQAIMDLGALVCTAKQPQCDFCPLRTHCCAFNNKTIEQFPTPRITKTIPTRSIFMLLLLNDKQEILLEKRAPMGIWGGLWSLPECATEKEATIIAKSYFCNTKKPQKQPSLLHTFSHFRLDIQPLLLPVKCWNPPLMDSTNRVWYKVKKPAKKGLATPVKKILQRLVENLT